MIQIYHNTRCSKSRCALALLQESGKSFEIVDYLSDTPTAEDLKALIIKIGIEPIALVRTNESIWKEQYKGKTLSNDMIIAAMVKHPILIERPIVVNGAKAVIGRPAESVLSIISDATSIF